MAKKRESEEEREKPKRHTNGALTPPVKMCHVATMCTALPLHIKCGTEPQESCLSKKPFTFWWSSWHARTTTELWGGGGLLKGLTNLLAQTNPLDTFVYLATSWMKEHQPLNGVFSTSNSYKISCQTVRSPSKPTLLSPEMLQKWH